MDLTSKLRQLLPQRSSPPPVQHRADLDPLLGGGEVDTPYGPCYLVTKELPLSHRHGRWFLETVFKASYENLGRLSSGAQQPLHLDRTLFLDTETTGLAGGTGTYAFLVGLGFFTPTGFVVKQLLMRDYNEELALLYLLDQELQQKEAVVSFNGQTFDLPLLQTRFALARLGLQGASSLAHYDLLPLSRRFWRRKLDSCSLGSLEENILGVQRSGDIPGYEIPQRYFDFLRTKDGRLLQDILEHNFIDIVSMASLLYRLQAVTELSPEECDCPFEAEALSRLAQETDQYQLALDYLSTAAALAQERELQIRILKQSAALFKRLGEYERAAVLWRKVLAWVDDDLHSAEELAKYYEHRIKDLESAERITKRALAHAWLAKSPRIPDWEHRLARIEGKIRRQAVDM